MLLHGLFKSAQNLNRRRRMRRSWEHQWRKPNFCPNWLADAPRPFVITGFERGWLAPRMTVLEIGCGRGRTAAWLAERGLQVVALDISPYVIEQARKRFCNQPDLEFRCADVCVPANLSTVFDVILDTGCLQHLHPSLRGGYCENLLVWSRPGSRFVVTMHKVTHSASERRLGVQALLSTHFDLVYTEEVPPANAEKFRHLNSVFHFVRR